MLWSQRWINPEIGYSVSSPRETSIKILNSNGEATSWDKLAYRYDQVYGNTGCQGRWRWKLADNLDNNAASCYDWYSKQPSANLIEQIKFFRPNVCPNFRGQASIDRRFRFLGFSSAGICYQHRRIFGFSNRNLIFFPVCCYSWSRGNLNRDNDDTTSLVTHTAMSQEYHLSELGGFRQFQLRNAIKKAAVAADRLAYDYCCQKSALCHLFDEKRPKPIYSRYRPPFWGRSSY